MGLEVKNSLRAQSKYDLMGSSAKTGKIYIGGSQSMSSGMFRGRESSNRIELSQLVQELLNFGVLGSLWLWGGGGDWGAPTHVHMHAHTCMCGKHDNFMQMATPIGGIPGNSLWCHMRVHVHARMWVCIYVYVCRAPPHHPSPTSTQPHPPGGTPRISQNSITLEPNEIFQFHLKIWNL